MRQEKNALLLTAQNTVRVRYIANRSLLEENMEESLINPNVLVDVIPVTRKTSVKSTDRFFKWLRMLAASYGLDIKKQFKIFQDST